MVRGWGNVGAEVKRLKHGLFVAVSNWTVRIFQKILVTLQPRTARASCVV